MEILDILILGSGPAALCLASELAKQNLNIKEYQKNLLMKSGKILMGFGHRN